MLLFYIKILLYFITYLKWFIYFNSHLLDVLHEQEKSAIMQCENNDSDIKYKDDKQINDVSLIGEEGSSIKRWTTEEDLTGHIALERKTQSLADFTHGIVRFLTLY